MFAVAMNTGTQAAKEAGNLVDLDSNPTKLMRSWKSASSSDTGCAHDVRIANDVAKYFAIIPRRRLDLSGHSMCSILWTGDAGQCRVVGRDLHALIIIALIPLAL